jgi:N-acetylmuramoyl-L-alanine amidase
LVNTPDKEIYQIVDENKRAYHAGISFWRKDQQLNDTSIGIEIVNLGYTTDSLITVFLSLSGRSVQKVAALVKDIVTRYNIPPTNVLAHSDIAPTRKQDPAHFSHGKDYMMNTRWMWYDEAAKQAFQSNFSNEELALQYNDPEFVSKIQQQLVQFGYALPSMVFGIKQRSKRLRLSISFPTD